MNGKVYVVFNRKFSKSGKLFEVRPLIGIHVHRKVIVSKKWRQIDTLLLHTTNRNYMAYRFVPFPMTLDDLEGQSPNAGLIKCNSTSICATFSTVLTDKARRAVPRRQLSFLFATQRSYVVRCFSGTPYSFTFYSLSEFSYGEHSLLTM